MEAKALYELFYRHLAVWSEPDAGRRLALISDIYTPDFEMTDAHVAFKGSDNINAFVDQLQSRFPGSQFSLTRPLEHHHDVTRAFWQFGPPGKPPATTGQDIVISKDGRIHQLFVFLDGVNIISQPSIK